MNLLSSVYEKKSYIIQKKAYILLWIQLILIPVIVTTLFINLFRNQNGELTGIMFIDIVFILSMILGIIFLRAGRYPIAVYINIIVIIFLTISGHYAKLHIQAETGFNSFSIYIYPAIIFTALFARRIILFLVSLVFVIMTIWLYLSLMHVVADPVCIYLLSSAMNTVIAIISVGCLSFLSSLITDQSLLSTESELERNKEFSKTLESRVVELKQTQQELYEVSDHLEEKVTERTAELLQSQEKYRNVVERANDGILIVKDDVILYANPSATKMVGYAMAELIGNPFYTFIHPDEKERVTENYQRRLAGKDVETIYETSLSHKKGETIDVEFNIGFIPYEDGRALLIIVRNNTFRKKMEKERERIIKELKEAMSNIKTLSGMLPICASCKKIRKDDGYWQQIESYVKDHSEADFSHGICPDCARALYPDLELYNT
jgi:PAS domain S-box-containing protein